MMFVSENHGYVTVCQGNGFVSCGSAAALDEVDLVLKAHFDTKILPRIGPTAYGGEVPEGKCEGGGDVVGVVTSLVGGVAHAFHDDQVVELRVQLGVQEVEGKDREEQVEVESERRVKEVRPWI